MLWKRYRRPLLGWGFVPGPLRDHREHHEGWCLFPSCRIRQKLLCTLYGDLSVWPFRNPLRGNLPALSLWLPHVSYKKLWHGTGLPWLETGCWIDLFKVVGKVVIDQSMAVPPKRTRSTSPDFLTLADIFYNIAGTVIQRKPRIYITKKSN